MLEILGSVVASIFSGGATGILGIVAQRFFDYKNKQLDIQMETLKFSHEVELRKADAEIMDKEWQGRLKVAQSEGDAAKDVAESKAFEASYGYDNTRYSEKAFTSGQNWVFVILDFARGVVRPALTLYLCILVTLIYYTTRDKLRGEDLTPDQALELYKLLIGSIIYVWTTVSLWFFGTRNKAQPPSRA